MQPSNRGGGGRGQEEDKRAGVDRMSSSTQICHKSLKSLILAKTSPTREGAHSVLVRGAQTLARRAFPTPLFCQDGGGSRSHTSRNAERRTKTKSRPNEARMGLRAGAASGDPRGAASAPSWRPPLRGPLHERLARDHAYHARQAMVLVTCLPDV